MSVFDFPGYLVALDNWIFGRQLEILQFLSKLNRAINSPNVTDNLPHGALALLATV
jgi:hypothetical protein